MNNQPRHISLPVFLSVLPQYPVFFRLAIVFLALPLLVMLPAIYIVSSFTGSAEKNYDYTKIKKEGIPLKGVITRISTVYYTKINNDHPKIINYSYSIDGKQVDAKIETLDLQKVQQFRTGDSVDIQVFNGQSAIKNITPFGFPFALFYFLPLPFLITGIIFTIILLNRASRQFRLYKHGDLKVANLISVMHKPITGRSNVGKNLLIATYDYVSVSGKKLTGTSTANYSNALMSKKPGDTIKIFTSKKDETSSCLVPEKLI